MNENQYRIESSLYREHIRKVVELVDDISSDKKLGKRVREYIEEEFPK